MFFTRIQIPKFYFFAKITPTLRKTCKNLLRGVSENPAPANDTPRPMCRGLESSQQTHNTKGRLNLDKSRGFPVAKPVWWEIA